jgi:hypothetical protein
MTKSANTLNIVIEASSGGLTANADDLQMNYAGTAQLADVDAAVEAAGTSELVARGDHKHSISTAAPGTIQVGDAANAGSANSVAKSDHTHALTAPSAPANVTKAAAATGSSANVARQDHKHDVSTAAPAAGSVAAGNSAAEGSGTSLSRSDHQHPVSVAAPSNVGTANAAGSANTFVRSDHVHASPKPATGNKNMTASVTSSDGNQATATTVAASNALGGYMGVKVNGILQLVGNGAKASVDCYFSGDSGTNARSFADVVVGDTLHWNGSVAGFELDANDKIDIEHMSF